METPRKRRREIDILAPAEVAALMGACSRRAPTGVRHRALIALLYGTGVRIGEALALKPKDLDLDRLAVTIQNGKNDKRRVAALLPDAVDAIQRWLDRRAALGISGHHVVFCTLGRGLSGPFPTAPGGRLVREFVARVLRRVARKAGVHRRVHPHGFRHAHADLLRRRGWDVEEIRKQLGHASLAITGQYLDHLGAHDLPDKMRAMAPVLSGPPPTDPRKELGDLLGRMGERDVAQLVALLRRTAP